MFYLIIGGVVAMIIVAIFMNAIQQHKERIEAEKRTELAKLKSIVDETEDVLMASAQFPISQQLVYIMHQRIFGALKVMLELNPKLPDIRQRVKEADERSKAIDLGQAAPSDATFSLPNNEKQIIVYIQGIKKLRALLRSEHSKGKVDTQTFLAEDKRLDRLQLKVNVETLIKRGAQARQSNMIGSARQYLEKAVAALESQTDPDEYILTRRQFIAEQLQEISDNLRNVNASDRRRKQEAEKDELDELFAPKKKW